MAFELPESAIHYQMLDFEGALGTILRRNGETMVDVRTLELVWF